MARSLCALLFLALVSSTAADLSLLGPKVAMPKATVAKGTVPKKVTPTAAPKVLPTVAKKVPAKDVPVKPAAPLVEVSCKTDNINKPFRITTCSVLSRHTTAMCVKLNCAPKLGAPCLNGHYFGPKTPLTTQNCSWTVNADCSSPYPLYPLQKTPMGKPSGQWAFGFMTQAQGPISVSLASATKAVNGACPKN